MSRGFAILRGGVADAAATAAEAEQLGYDAAWSTEFYTRSAVVSLAAMAGATSAVKIGSSIAYAVGRTPLVLATEARSLDELSGGRLILGLGTGTTRMMANWHGVDPAGCLTASSGTRCSPAGTSPRWGGPRSGLAPPGPVATRRRCRSRPW